MFSVFGFSPMQVTILVLTMAQNSGYALLRRYSQGVLKEQTIASTILLVSEIIKFACSFGFIMVDSTASGAPYGSLFMKMAWLGQTSMTMLVPAAVYLAMNLLSFVALQRIDAGLFTVIAQAKILTTAIFGRVMMGRSLHARKWRALTLIVIGAVLISNQRKPAKFGQAEGVGGTADFLIGLVACLMEITLSGAVSVYFEKVLKKESTPHTVWDRNVQLAVMSGITYVPLALFETKGTNIFVGFSGVTIIVAAVGAAGGILVALAMRYTDAVIKCLATSGSIVATTLIGAIWLGASLDLVIVLASCAVVLAVFNFFDEGGKLEPPKPALDKNDIETGKFDPNTRKF